MPTLRALRGRQSGDIHLHYLDGTNVSIKVSGSHVRASTPPGQTIEDTAAYLLGPVMGLVLRLRGIHCLHGSAVAIDGRAVAFVGPSGAGKSSTAAAFARLGYPVLTDDVLALTDMGKRFEVRPAYPRVRLWPEAATALFGGLPKMTPTWEKRFLALDGDHYRFQAEPLPLAAIYFLDPRLSVQGAPQVASVAPAEALLRFVGDSYAANYVYHSVRPAEFEMFSRLVTSVPLRRIAAADDFASIDAFCESILADFSTFQQFQPQPCEA
ncbi:MAG: hypothetical protein V4731_12430 [Pseudomonadota bacterium]